MIMREPPSRISVLDTVKKLGFKVDEIAGGKERTRRIKDYTVDLEAKRDQKILLGLAYYSNNLLQNLTMDACVGRMIVRQMIIGNQKEYSIEKLIAEARSLAKLLRNEYLLRDPRGFPETIFHRIQLLQGQNEIMR